jgi:hypothetical protein
MLAYFIVPCMRNLNAFTYSNLPQTSQTLQYKIGTEMKDAKVDFSSHVQGCECYIRHIRVGARKTLQIYVFGAVCGRIVNFFVFLICFSVVLMTHTCFIITLACVLHTRMCRVLRTLRGFFSVQVSLLHAEVVSLAYAEILKSRIRDIMFVFAAFPHPFVEFCAFASSSLRHLRCLYSVCVSGHPAYPALPAFACPSKDTDTCMTLHIHMLL